MYGHDIQSALYENSLLLCYLSEKKNLISSKQTDDDVVQRCLISYEEL